MSRLVLSVALFALVTAACQEATTDPTAEATQDIAFKKVAKVPVDQSPLAMDMSEWVVELDGGTAAVAYFEYITAGDDGEQVGRTVFASNRGNKQLDAHWVPGDERRGGFADIAYAVDGTEGAASELTVLQTTEAIDRAMATWDGMNCSNIPITNLGVAPFDLGYVQWLVDDTQGIPGWLADFTHAGWLPGAFFDNFAPGGGGFILGATFTFVWIDTGTGDNTDIDGNGKDDVAFREVYYNDAFVWTVDVNSAMNDVETVAYHEAGHGLSQGHFGDIFRTAANGKFHFAPRAVMNAAYSGVQRSPTGTDNGGHCSIWGSWPNN